jgi:hypothetical protein
VEARAVLRAGAAPDLVRAGLAGLGPAHLAEGGLALADSALRGRLALALAHWGEAGAHGGGDRRGGPGWTHVNCWWSRAKGSSE